MASGLSAGGTTSAEVVSLTLKILRDYKTKGLNPLTPSDYFLI